MCSLSDGECGCGDGKTCSALEVLVGLDRELSNLPGVSPVVDLFDLVDRMPVHGFGGFGECGENHVLFHRSFTVKEAADFSAKNYAPLAGRVVEPASGL